MSGLALPPDFAARIRDLFTPGRRARFGLQAVIVQSKEKGWTYQAIADALGVSRERIRQIAAAAPPTAYARFLHITIPDVPVKHVPVKAVAPTLTPEQAAELRQLRHLAQPKGHYPAGHPAYAASRELARLLDRYLMDGHRMIDLARCLGCTSTAIRMRLGRWGYRGLPPSIRPKWTNARAELRGGE